MNLFIYKLVIGPLLIGGATLAGRIWGAGVSGWLVGMPLNSAPVIYFIALTKDQSFTISTIMGTLSGGVAVVSFCLAYSWLAVKFSWPICISGSMLCFAGTTLVMRQTSLPLPALALLVPASILAGLRLMPKSSHLGQRNEKPGKWDLPARMFISMVFILLVTSLAPFIGPRLTGLISVIPIHTAILGIFAHRLQGSAGAAGVMRGLLYGLFGFTGFYISLALLIGRLNPGLAFTGAILTVLVINSFSLFFLRHTSK